MEKNASRIRCDKRKIIPLMEKLCEKYGIFVPLESNIAGLPLGVKQKVEILKALYRGGKVIILDEPTTVLTPQETEELFELLKRLKNQGCLLYTSMWKAADSGMWQAASETPWRRSRDTMRWQRMTGC